MSRKYLLLLILDIFCFNNLLYASPTRYSINLSTDGAVQSTSSDDDVFTFELPGSQNGGNLLQQTSSLHAAGKQYGGGRAVSTQAPSDEVLHDSYGNPVTPFTAVEPEGEQIAGKAIRHGTGKSQIGYKTDVNTEKDGDDKSGPHNIITFTLPSYASGITNLQGLLRDSKKPSITVAEPNLDLLPPFEPGHQNNQAADKNQTTGVDVNKSSKVDDNEIKDGASAIKSDDNDASLSVGPLIANGGNAIQTPSTDLLPPFLPTINTENPKPAITEITDNLYKREDTNKNKKSVSNGDQCADNQCNLSTETNTQNDISRKENDTKEKPDGVSNKETSSIQTGSSETQHPGKSDVGEENKPFIIKVEDISSGPSGPGENVESTPSLTSNSNKQFPSQTVSDKAESPSEPSTLDSNQDINNNINNNGNSQTVNKPSIDLEPPPFSAKDEANLQKDDSAPLRFNLDTNTSPKAVTPPLNKQDVPHVQSQSISDHRQEKQSQPESVISPGLGRYTGGFGGASGILGEQKHTGYAIQPDGSIKIPDYHPINDQQVHNAQGEANTASSTVKPADYKPYTGSFSLQTNTGTTSPTLSSVINPIDSKPQISTPVALTGTNNLHTPKPVESKPYTGGFGGSPGILGLQTQTGTALPASSFNQNSQQIPTSNSNTANIPSQDILPPLYSNNPFLNPSVAAQHPKPSTDSVQANNQKPDVHYTGNFGGSPGILGLQSNTGTALPILSSTTNPIDSKPQISTPVALTNTNNLHTPKPVDSKPYTGSFGGSPGILGLQTQTGTAVPPLAFNQNSVTGKPVDFKPQTDNDQPIPTSNSNTANTPSQEILPPLYSNNPFLNPSVVAQHPKPSTDSVQANNQKPYVHHTGGFGQSQKNNQNVNVQSPSVPTETSSKAPDILGQPEQPEEHLNPATVTTTTAPNNYVDDSSSSLETRNVIDSHTSTTTTPDIASDSPVADTTTTESSDRKVTGTFITGKPPISNTQYHTGTFAVPPTGGVFIGSSASSSSFGSHSNNPNQKPISTNSQSAQGYIVTPNGQVHTTSIQSGTPFPNSNQQPASNKPQNFGNVGAFNQQVYPNQNFKPITNGATEKPSILNTPSEAVIPNRVSVDETNLNKPLTPFQVPANKPGPFSNQQNKPNNHYSGGFGGAAGVLGQQAHPGVSLQSTTTNKPVSSSSSAAPTQNFNALGSSATSSSFGLNNPNQKPVSTNSQSAQGHIVTPDGQLHATSIQSGSPFPNSNQQSASNRPQNFGNVGAFNQQVYPNQNFKPVTNVATEKPSISNVPSEAVVPNRVSVDETNLNKPLTPLQVPTNKPSQFSNQQNKPNNHYSGGFGGAAGVLGQQAHPGVLLPSTTTNKPDSSSSSTVPTQNFNAQNLNNNKPINTGELPTSFSPSGISSNIPAAQYPFLQNFAGFPVAAQQPNVNPFLPPPFTTSGGLSPFPPGTYFGIPTTSPFLIPPYNQFGNNFGVPALGQHGSTTFAGTPASPGLSAASPSIGQHASGISPSSVPSATQPAIGQHNTLQSSGPSAVSPAIGQHGSSVTSPQNTHNKQNSPAISNINALTAVQNNKNHSGEKYTGNFGGPPGILSPYDNLQAKSLRLTAAETAATSAHKSGAIKS